jgi:hypothetical protein
MTKELWQQANSKLGEELRLQSHVEDVKVNKERLQKEEVEKIKEFMASSEGAEGLRLLQNSKKYIRVAEGEPFNGFTTVFFLDGGGFKRSHEASGTWVAYSKEVPEPKISPATIEECVQEAVWAGRDPDKILNSIKARLNSIAEEVLKK